MQVPTVQNTRGYVAADRNCKEVILRRKVVAGLLRLYWSKNRRVLNASGVSNNKNTKGGCLGCVWEIQFRNMEERQRS